MTSETAQLTEPLVVTRTFAAPPAVVFKAWSSADHMKRWFSPEGFSVPEAEIDLRPGGVFAICMRSPQGDDNWLRGAYTEVAPPHRLAFTGEVAFGGVRRFTAHTTVNFEGDNHGTLLTVRQVHEIHDPAFSFAIDGAPEGWRTTLDRLAKEVERISREPEARSVVHGAFTLERVFAASPARVFHALTDEAAKARWFAGGFEQVERHMDVRPGGRERLRGRWASGMVTTFDAVYLDVVPGRRLIYAYEMHLDDRKISVSLATMDIEPAGAGTRLKVTEQGAFLDGFDDAGTREHGTGVLLDQLVAAVDG